MLDDKGKPLVEESLVQFGYVVDADGKRVPNMVSMLELGFVPTFYQFVDTVIEVKLALRVSQAPPAIDPSTGDVKAQGKGRRRRADRQQCTGGCSLCGAYNFNLELASVFRTKLVCVPPPAMLEERLRALAQDGGLVSQGQG